MANRTFFSCQKRALHLATNVSFELDPGNVVLMCQRLKIQHKDGVLKAVKWNSTGFWPCSVPRRHQHFFLGQVFLNLLSPETQALVTHLSRHLLSIFHVPGTVPHGGCLVVQWRSFLMEFTILTGPSDNKQTGIQTITNTQRKNFCGKGCSGVEGE